MKKNAGGVRSRGVSLDTYAAENSYAASGAKQSGGTRHVPTHADRQAASGSASGRERGLYVPNRNRTREDGKTQQQTSAAGRETVPGKRAGNRRRGGNNLPKLLLLFLLLLIAGVIGFGIFRLKGSEKKSEKPATEQNGEAADSFSSDDASEEGLTEEGKKLAGIRKYLESGRPVIETLRTFYPEYLICYSATGYVFEPINEKLEKHSYKAEEVEVLPDGRWQYVRNGKVISEQGIDVSSHQGEIDWAKVKAAGVDFAMLRVLYRGYESGKLVEDKCFRQNLEGALANDIRVGAYIFTQAITEAEVDEEIEMLKGLAGSEAFSFPVVIDVEEANEGKGRLDQLSREERTRLVKHYCDALKEAGYTPMIYMNLKTALIMLDTAQLQDTETWFADYDTDFYYPYGYTMWQYSETGKIDGIDGYVDLDLSFRKK